MHEISLAVDILRMVEAAAEREHFKRVGQLRLEAGALACIELQALRFALAAMAPGTCLDGAEIIIVETPGTAWCQGCKEVVSIDNHTEPCPRCGAYPLRTTGGTDLRVLDLMVFDD
ncbi:hydrogenase maturation nickel metallochaperone HypA [Serratia sp. S1B]|nr:hydrogenase maturation nickel metallochaperone HypA [Serratia sp. S1B]